MNDIAELWQQQSLGDITSIVKADKRKRHRLFLQDWALALVMLVSGMLFLAISQSALPIIAAIALFSGAALQLRQAYLNRSTILCYEDWSTLGLLEYRLLVNETETKRLHYSQYGAAGIIVFTVLLTVLKYIFDIAVPEKLIIVYWMIMPFMIAMICFDQWCIIRNRKNWVYLHQLAREFMQADGTLE